MLRKLGLGCQSAASVCVCEGFVICGCFWYYVYCTLTEVFLNLTEVFLNLTEGFLTLTEVFPCFSLSCKSNASVKLTKTRHGPHSSTLVCICVVRLLFVLFYVLFVCKCVLLPGDNPTAVNKYIISYHIISYHIISYHIISYHIISYQSYHIISYHIISYIISYHIISYHIISYHIISYHIISRVRLRYRVMEETGGTH